MLAQYQAMQTEQEGEEGEVEGEVCGVLMVERNRLLAHYEA